MKRGSVSWANLDPRTGHEIEGKRPIIIVSENGFNKNPSWGTINVIPLTTSERQFNKGPSVVVFPSGVGKLKKPCAALCHQITTLDKDKLIEQQGELKEEEMTEIVISICNTLGIDISVE